MSIATKQKILLVNWKTIKVITPLNGTAINVPYNIISFIFKTERYKDVIIPINIEMGAWTDITNNKYEKLEYSVYRYISNR